MFWRRRENKWFSFFDISSGGQQKTEYQCIYIEAPTERAASKIFKKRFDRSPYWVTCECCGPDFSIDEVENIDKEFEEGDLKIYAR